MCPKPLILNTKILVAVDRQCVRRKCALCQLVIGVTVRAGYVALHNCPPAELLACDPVHVGRTYSLERELGRLKAQTRCKSLAGLERCIKARRLHCSIVPAGHHG